MTHTRLHSNSPCARMVRNALALVCFLAWLLMTGLASAEVLIQFLQQPSNVVVLLNNPASFSVVAQATVNETNLVPLTYQWQRRLSGESEWLNLPEGANSTYSLPRTTACSQTPSFFRCGVSAGDVTALSQVAEMTVIVDCSPPSVVSVSGDARLNQVVVQFSTDMQRDAAMSDPFSYALFEDVTFENFSVVRVDVLDARTAVLFIDSTTPLRYDTTYRLFVNGLSDLSDPACGCNLLPPNTTFRFNIPPKECLRITQQPRSRTLNVWCPATFEVAARWMYDSVPRPVSYQWYKNGEIIDGATNTTYTIPNVHMADSGSFFHAVVSSPCGSITSSNALLTVSPDLVPPRFISARPGPISDTVVLSFESSCGAPDGGMDSLGLLDVLNYQFSGDVLAYAVYSDCSSTNAIVFTSPQQPGITYAVAAMGITDMAGNVMQGPETNSFTAPIRVPVPSGTLRFTMEGRQVMLEWATGGILQAADKLGEPWIDQDMGFGRPVFVVPSPCPGIGANTPSQRFYRVRWPAPAAP